MVMSITPTQLHKQLTSFFGYQKWWPIDNEYHKQHNTDPRVEIIIGAILTQNTAWKNVERALNNLKHTDNLSIEQLLFLPEKDLKKLIQPSGYFNQKAERLKRILIHINRTYNNDISILFSQQLMDVRNELLSINGIGPETADSILLYAGSYPIFVVDAYTKRISKRLPISLENDSYKEIQQVFQKDLAENFSKQHIIFIYQQLHALIVELAKNYCKSNPECNTCPIKNICCYTQSH